MKLSNWKQFKVRTDLQVSPQSQEGEVVYVVKDPLTLRYFRLRPAEYAILRMLDGETSPDEIIARLTRLGHEVSQEELELFLRQLGSASFFENVLPNQSESLYRMALLRRSRRSLWQQLKRILYIKVPLYDPDRLFTRVMPYIRFLWSPWAAVIYAALLIFGTYAFFAKYEEATRDFGWLLAPEGLLILAVVMFGIKILHEIGHGLTCKRYGGEVHELGVLVLVLMPCMYCNITDAWIMEKRWKKVLTSVAGIVTELLIAAIAAVYWYFSPPGTLNAMAYRIMIITGGYSVFFNANPLMKWDGYYILGDILGMPNLRANSIRYFSQFFRKYVLGMDAPEAGEFTRSRMIQLVYGVLSTTWIIYVMFRITRGMLATWPAIGVWVLLSTLYGAIFIPMVRLTLFFTRRRGQAGEADLGKLSVLSAVLATGVYFMFIYNMGYSVTASCVIEASQRQILKARTPGVLVEMSLRQGDAVRSGDVVARLDEPRLRLAVEETLASIEACQIEIDQARSANELLRLDLMVEKRKSLEASLADLRGRIDGLVIRAPFSGTMITPPPESRVGTYLQEGADICEIADLATAKVSIAVPEPDVKYVRQAAEASVVLRAYPWRKFKGTVDAIGIARIGRLPNAALSALTGGNVLTRPDIQSAQVPIDTLYQVNILVPNDKQELLIGMAGKATIASGNRRLYDQIYVYARENLRRSFGI